jgi:hypothetical protein
VGRRDREKLEEYLTGVRKIEAQIERAERLVPDRDPQWDTPPEIPADHAQQVQLLYDMMVVAFHTDSTRVASLLLVHDGSNRSFPEVRIPDGHRDLSHQFNNEEEIRKVAEIDRWYVAHFASFFRWLEQTRDTDGRSLPDNARIVYRGGNADANRHTHSNLPLVLAGGGGGTLNPGRYVPHGWKPTSNLFLSLADRMGIAGLERIGDSTGRLTRI